LRPRPFPTPFQDFLARFEAGVLRKELRWIPPGVDPETGEITDGHKRQFIGLAAGNVIDFVDAVANLKPEKPKTWGGRQDRCQPCPDHPHARIVKRVTFHCEECGAQLGDPIDEPIAAAPPTPQDAAYQDESPRPARDQPRVGTVLISPTVRFSDNGADSRNGRTLVAGSPAPFAGTRTPPGRCLDCGEKVLPGTFYCAKHSTAPPDRYIDVAYGAPA
jgi:hypothetical protein